MRSNIIKKGTADEVRCVVTELRLSETFMGVPQLSVKVVSPVTVDIEIGDYIVYDYNGVTYTLREMPGREKHARPSTYGGAFVYNLVFHGPEWDLRNAPFLDLVLYDNGQHFTSMPDVTTYEDVYGIAARVQANMDNMYPGKWEIRVVSGLSAYSTLAKRLSETQDFSLSDGKCLDALSQVYSQWGVSFVYSYESGKHVITIGGAETQENTTGLFMYGRGNGLKVIKSSVQNASEIATRYYVYGGTQNMRPRYYNAQLYTPELSSQNTGADSSAIGELLLPMSVIGGSMYIPNLMIPISKWGKTKWYAWYNADSGLVFTEIRNPQQGQSYIFKNPNIGSFLGVVSGRGSDYVQYEGVNYSWVAEINFPDIRKAYIDAPQSYIDKYGIRPATLRFDGSGEREDIHPSIKGLTIGDIRTGLGSGAEYYPSTSVYTDPDERVDKVLSCDNPADDGLNTEDGNKYVAEDSVINNSIIREYEMKVRDDGWRGYMKGKTYLSGNYGKITVTRKGYLDFRLPLVATVENGEQYNITAGVEVYKKDSSGHNSLIIQYTTTNQPIKGDPEENIYFGLNVPDNKVSVDEGDILSISLWFQAVTDNVYLNTIKWTVPEFTMIWRYELSLDSYFYIKLKQIGFDISQISTNDGEYPVISITSGQCGGYEFEIHDATYSASDDSWMLRCARVQDGTLGQWFPNNVFKIEPEDLFVLLNIALPRVYITSNEQHLYDTALAERLYEERPLLEPEIDNKVMAESPQVLHAGMWFSVKDTDLGLVGTDGDSYLILIDSVEVTDKPDAIRSFKVTLRNNKEDNVFTLMQKQIVRTSSSIRTERRNQTKTSVTKAPESNSSEGSVNSADFVTLSTETGKKTFAEDVVFGADGGRMFIPSATPGTYDLFVDSGMAIEGDAPAPGGGGLDEDELWAELGGNAQDKVIGLPHLPDIPVSNVSGLLDESSRILPSLLPDYLLGQLLYGGTISASSVATVSAAFKDRYGVSASVLIISETNAALYEGVYFIASAEGTSGIMSSLDARTGDWIVSNGEQWVKIDNTDAVSSVAGLTGVISKAALQSALADTTHRFVTDAQISGWNAKWEWDEEEIKAVKVDNATHADSAGSVPLSGIENMGSGWLSALSETKPTTISGYGITDAYTKTQVNEALKAFEPGRRRSRRTWCSARTGAGCSFPPPLRARMTCSSTAAWQ